VEDELSYRLAPRLFFCDRPPLRATSNLRSNASSAAGVSPSTLTVFRRWGECPVLPWLPRAYSESSHEENTQPRGGIEGW